MGEGNNIPPRDRYIDATFGPGGYLSRAMPGFTARAGQVALARSVDQAIAERKHLLAEGPTGTGKSLAYAVPASYYAALTGMPSIIVTANIALSEQIVTKDLPALQAAVPWQFTFALVKGRNNYACLDKRDQFKADEFAHQEYRPTDPTEKRHLKVVREWIKASEENGAENETGDKSELPFEPSAAIWGRFSVSGEECKGDKCKYRDRCFSQLAIEKAKEADVIVTNYHLLYTHVRVYMGAGLDLVLPPWEICILDEAHKAADIARDVFGFRLTLDMIRRIAAKVPPIPETRKTEELAGRFFLMLGALKHTDRYKSRILGRFTQPEMDLWGELENCLAHLGNEIDKKVKALQTAYNDFEHKFLDEAKDMLDELADTKRMSDRCTEIAGQLDQVMHAKAHEDSVYFIQEDERKVTIHSKLVFPRNVLTPFLFDHVAKWREEGGDIRTGRRATIIATSATLATDGDSFAYIADEIGAKKGEYNTIVAQSPFDWKRQCIFIVPEDVLEPNAEGYSASVIRAIERTILLAGGRTLALFTSRARMDEARQGVARACKANGIRLLCQDDMPRTKLVQEFKEDVKSVLFGLESFWAGVDVPGESCSVVIMDRLMFPTPDDPIMSKISSDNPQWFRDHSIPRAMIAFKQGFGRAVRSMQCRAAVVCLDKRITSKGYGKDFRRALPPVGKGTDLNAIVEWLQPQPEPEEEAWDS